eukprot:1969362-Ditylum_brightwellii.AAC.1
MDVATDPNQDDNAERITEIIVQENDKDESQETTADNKSTTLTTTLTTNMDSVTRAVDHVIRRLQGVKDDVQHWNNNESTRHNRFTLQALNTKPRRLECLLTCKFQTSCKRNTITVSTGRSTSTKFGV